MAKKLLVTEEQEQNAFVQWLQYKNIVFTSIPNESKRSVVYGAKLKRMGLQKGFPDLLILSRSEIIDDLGYAGIAIEMKSKTGKIRVEQQEWLDKLSEIQWVTRVCYSASEAIDFMEKMGY